MEIITKSQWNANNTYFTKSGVTLWEKAIENALYNFAQVLEGNYTPFGVTNSAMQGEKSLVKGYASKIANVARSIGVKFGDKGSVKAVASKQPETMPTIEEFHELLLVELGKSGNTDAEAVTLSGLITQFDKGFDRTEDKKVSELSQEDQDAYNQHAMERYQSRISHKSADIAALAVPEEDLAEAA